MAVKFANLASTTLSSAITNSATSIAVADASLFPTLGSGDYFYATIGEGSGSEIVKVTAISSNTLTVTRAQDGTTASAFSSGETIALRVVAAALDDIASQAQTAADTESVSIDGDTMTGDLSGTNISLSGSITATRLIDADNSNAYLDPNGASVLQGSLLSKGHSSGDNWMPYTDGNFYIRAPITTFDNNVRFSDGTGTLEVSGDSSGNQYLASWSGQIRIRPNGTTINKIVLDASYINAPAYQVGGTSVLTGGRALENITSISSGAIASSGVVTSAGLQFNTNFTNPTNTSAAFYDQASVGPTASGYKFQVRTGSNNAMAAAITVDNSQNTQLHGTLTSGAITTSGNLVLDSSGYNYIELHSSATNTRKWRFYNGQHWNQDALLIYDQDADSTVLTIETNKLGVNRGAASLSHNLDVGGTVAISGTQIIDGSRNLTNIGSVTATGLGINESSRLSPVHVTVTSSQTALTLQNTQGGGGSHVALDFVNYADGSGYANPSARISAVDDGSHGGNVTFYGKASGIAGALSAIMTVKAKGDVEVNSGDLDIKSGDLELNGTARITNAGNATLGTIYANSGSTLTLSGNANYGVTLNHGDTGTSVNSDALSIRRTSTTGTKKVQIGLITNDTDGTHHRGHIYAERDTINYGGKVVIRVRSSASGYDNAIIARYNGDVEFPSGDLKMGSTTFITSGRNLTNIGTINNVNIAQGGSLQLDSGTMINSSRHLQTLVRFTTNDWFRSSDSVPRFYFENNGATYIRAASDWYLQNNSGANVFKFTSTGVVQHNGTQILDASRNLSNIASISSGSISSSGTLTVSSYAAVGSIVAADPGSSYYSYNNRIGSGLAVVGTFNNFGDTVISGGLTVGGNLTVNGTTTTINTTNLQVEDKNIVLNYSSGDSSSSADGAGITIQDAVNSTTDASMTWSAADDRFEFSHSIAFDGTPTTTDQNRGIFWSGYDKEGTTDYTDAASIRHTVNAGGHTGSVLLISSQNDASDGIAFVTNASSKLKHNNYQIYTTQDFTNNSGNWNTAYTYSQVGHLPLSGGNMTGAVNMGSNNLSGINNATAVSFLSTNGYWVGGTQRINGSGNLVNIGTITTSGVIAHTANEGREIQTYMPSSYTTNDIVAGHEYGWYNDYWRIGISRSGNTGGEAFRFNYSGSYVAQIGTTGIFDGTGYRVSGTTVISSSRNLININAITTSSSIHIDSSAHANVQIDRGSTSSHNNLLFYTAGTLNWRLWQSGADNIIALRRETSGVNVLSFTDSNATFAGNITSSGTISSGAITTTGILTVDTSPASNGVGDLKIIPTLNNGQGVGYAGQVIGVNIQDSVSSANNSPVQDSTWGGVTGATAIALQTDDNDYGQFQVWTSPQNSSSSTVLTPRLWVNGDGDTVIGSGILTVQKYGSGGGQIGLGDWSNTNPIGISEGLWNTVSSDNDYITVYARNSFNVRGYSGGTTHWAYLDTSTFNLVQSQNFQIGGNTVIDGSRNLTNITTATISGSTSVLLTLNPTANNYGGIAFQYGGSTKGFSIYNAGAMVYGGESGVNTYLQAGGQYGLAIRASDRNVSIGSHSSFPQKLYVNGNIRADGAYYVGGAVAIDSSRNVTPNRIMTDYFDDAGGTRLFRKGDGSGATRHLNLWNSTADPSNADSTTDNHITGISWGQRSDNEPYYMIYVDRENYGGYNYSRLRLNWHTGIQIGASQSYGGTRFYNDSRRGAGGGSLIFSVGDGDSFIRAYGGIKVGSTPTTVIDASRAITNITGISGSGNWTTSGYIRATSSSDAVGLGLRSTQEVLSGEGWCTALYNYNVNDGFLVVRRDGSGNAYPHMHVSGYNNPSYAGYTSGDGMVTITRSTNAKNAGSSTAGTALTSGPDWSRWIKTSTATVFQDADNQHEFKGNIQAGISSVNGNRFNIKVLGYDASVAYDVAMKTEYDAVYGRSGQIITTNAWLELNTAQSNGNIIMQTGSGKVGINTDSPVASGLQIGTHTFTGGNGVYDNSRIGMMVNGTLKSYVYASTYNDATYPDYGLVFIHGPNTSSYNVWSISPDGPAKGDSLNFIYGSNATNIHVHAPKVVFDGNGDVDIRSGALKLNGTTVFSSARDLQNVTASAGSAGFKFATNNWFQDSGNHQRFYFEGSGRTFFGSQNGYIFRDSSDVGRATISNSGGINLASGGDGQVASNVALAIGGTTVLDTSRNMSNVNLVKFRTESSSFYQSDINPNTLNAQYNSSSDSADMWINYRGYANGFTQFRDFRIGDGKGNALLFVDGSAKTFDFQFGSVIQLGGTTVIDASRSINNIPNIAFQSANGTNAMSLNDGSVNFRTGTDHYHKMWYFDGLCFGTNESHGHFRFYAESNTQRNNGTGGKTLVFDIDSQNQTVTASGNITAYSDIKLKDDIQPIENALDKVCAIRGVTYTRKDHQDKTKRHMGVIAQEVEAAGLNEVVEYNEEKDVKTVSYGNMVGVLIEAMKEQQQTIDSLTKRIEELENGNN